jgi:hypothetical protein
VLKSLGGIKALEKELKTDLINGIDQTNFDE